MQILLTGESTLQIGIFAILATLIASWLFARLKYSAEAEIAEEIAPAGYGPSEFLQFWISRKPGLNLIVDRLRVEDLQTPTLGYLWYIGKLVQLETNSVAVNLLGKLATLLRLLQFSSWVALIVSLVLNPDPILLVSLAIILGVSIFSLLVLSTLENSLTLKLLNIFWREHNLPTPGSLTNYLLLLNLMQSVFIVPALSEVWRFLGLGRPDNPE